MGIVVVRASTMFVQASAISNATYDTHGNLVFLLESTKLLLLGLVCLDQGLKHLLDTRVVGLESRRNILNRPLNENTTNQTVACAFRFCLDERL